MQKITELTNFNTPINFQKDSETLRKFLLFYCEEGVYKYLDAIKVLNDTIVIHLADIVAFEDPSLAQRMQRNAYSYMRIISKLVDEIIYNDGDAEIDDVFYHHRISRFKEKYPDRKPSEIFPAFLLKNYTVMLIPAMHHSHSHSSFSSHSTSNYHSPSSYSMSIRELRAEHIGSLLSIRGIITRVSVVKPAAKVATYICENCGAETYQQINTEAFDLLEECASEKCKKSNLRGTLSLLTRGSKFLRFQTVQIQELTCDVPYGCIPRTITVECFAACTEKCRPGDYVMISGVFMPRPYYGVKKLKAGLLNDTFFYACQIDVLNKNVSLDLETLIPSALSIDKLVDSFAPEIFGLRDIKKILLLMLVGSPSLRRSDGMKIRGDINVLLMGDPGIAKSQLLKTAIRLSERGVYTTGRGSSGVGLTAAVNKDPVTKEVVLEGGALVLSDGGVCCIDELDKMSESDRIAIHEVMEQQSVSISKAGINTTLNARCSVLAAANLTRERYNPKKSLEYNVGLPLSLTSRFDLICILKDEAEKDYDTKIANHITSLHLMDEGNKEVYGYDQLSAYISKAKELSPVLSEGIRETLVTKYLEERKEGVTPRYLLAMIRLCLAHARLRLSEHVEREDVNAVLLLLESTKVPAQKKEGRMEPKYYIYNFITALAKEKGIIVGNDQTGTGRGRMVSVSLDDVFNACPHSREQIENAIADFASTGVWIRNNSELILFE